MNALAQIILDWRHQIIAEYDKNPWASSIVDRTEQDDRYIIVDDLIIYKGQIFLVLDSEVRITVLRAFHDLPMVSHPRYYKTYKMVRERFTWKGLRTNVLHYVRECSVCQQNKQEHTYPARLLQPLPIPDRKWERLSIDFIMGFLKAQGKDCIYVVVDWLTK